MSESKKTRKTSASDNEPSSCFRTFMWGLIFGLIVGVITGWCVRPPSSFPVEDLKRATEEKFSKASDHAREEFADFAEELARKLRK